jgi:hypothetical protein
MAASPFRRRKAAKTVRNLALAEAALALAKHRATAVTGHRSRRPSGKLLLLGGAVAAVGAAALLKRDKVAGLLPSHSGAPEPAAPVPPQPSNYDSSGPVANTATPIPAPDPQGRPPATVDAAAEEAAAAAEAGAIGGQGSAYAGTEPGEPADEAHRPLAESGEGEGEGLEQAEAELVDNATYRDAGTSDAEHQIEDAIEQAEQPQSGETPEPLASRQSDQPQSGATPAPPEPPQTDQPQSAAAPEPPAPEQSAPAAPEPAPAQETFLPPTPGPDEETSGGGISGRPVAGLDDPPATEPATEQQPGSKSGDAEGEDEGSDDWRTWSGRSVNP